MKRFCLCFSCRKFHKKLGQQAWLVAAITATEFLIVVKYDPYTLTLSLPFYITQCWILGIILVLTWTAWRFFIRWVDLHLGLARVLGGFVQPPSSNVLAGTAWGESTALLGRCKF